MRTRWCVVFWLALTAATACLGTRGHAQSTSSTDPGGLYRDEGTRLSRSNKTWAQSDACGKDSFRKFPDFTADGAQKRDAYVRDCLRRHHLPPRNDVAQPLQPGQ